MYTEFSWFRNTHLLELSSWTPAHVVPWTAPNSSQGEEGRDNPFLKWLRRTVLPLNAKMIEEGVRQTNLFCATNPKCGPVPSALIKLINLISITLLPQDELKLSQVDEVKHSHVLEQLNRLPGVQAIWPNICSGHWVRESRSNHEKKALLNPRDDSFLLMSQNEATKRAEMIKCLMPNEFPWFK